MFATYWNLKTACFHCIVIHYRGKASGNLLHMIFLFLYLELNHGQCCRISTQCGLYGVTLSIPSLVLHFTTLMKGNLNLGISYKSLSESVFPNLNPIIY